MLVAEFRLLTTPEEARRLYDEAIKMAKGASPFQQHLMVAVPASWPLRSAMRQFQETEADMQNVRENLPAELTIDFVVARCQERLDWLAGPELKATPAKSRLFVYEGCGKQAPLDAFGFTGRFASATSIPLQGLIQGSSDSAASAYVVRSVAYLAHIVERYEQLADFTIFLDGDAPRLIHLPYLNVVLQGMAARAYAVWWLPLGARRLPLVSTSRPCLGSARKTLLGTKDQEEPVALGPYCCGQFVAARTALQSRGREFAAGALGWILEDGHSDCNDGDGWTRTRALERLWHLIFGEVPDPPLREDDKRLPVALRLKHGTEHMRTQWVDLPLARDIPKKVVVDEN
eukprot:gnl/TRDRNA2_/TRDRNA2_143622_c0_seq2.p1 gnl/TRDRNA2_/TRDRNA2_143622_c0~~gnl/TRDRNA2_/TRDRNA2_143622_c0_seq2.p1  ORF type:complete len:393 (-),score=60.14 gnl/TRDRNA2_/TRDRNA2_143622_c0_seq2:46-1080(-)